MIHSVHVRSHRLTTALKDAGLLVAVAGTLPEFVDAITDDSRAVKPGGVFVAVRGVDRDGHEFLGAAEQGGVTAATITLLTPFRKLVHTITADNGKEFSGHERIAKKLGCGFYFAHPYHSWERGLNENTNGLLRQDFPKSTDFKQVSDAAVTLSIDQLNDRPRKTLGFKTPAALMKEELAALAA